MTGESTRRETTAAAQAAISTHHSKSNMTAYWRNVAQLAVQVAEALHYAHESGVLHRDIKPANLMLNTDGKIWVADFGLARLADDAGMTMTGDLVGTLRYMSPEQALAKRITVDHRTDIYSLGATLYELLTLKPMFEGEDRQALLRQVAFEDPVPLRRVNKLIPTELATIVLKATCKNPRRALPDGAGVRRRFTTAPGRQAHTGQKTNACAKSEKWSRRHRTLVTTAVLSVVVAWATASIWIWQERAEAIRLGQVAQENAEAT